jgi:transposase
MSACTRFYIYVHLQSKAAKMHSLASTRLRLTTQGKLNLIFWCFYTFCGYILIVVQILEHNGQFTRRPKHFSARISSVNL